MVREPVGIRSSGEDPVEIRRRSGGYQVEIRWRSGRDLEEIRWLSGGDLEEIRWSLEEDPVVIRWRSGGDPVIRGRSGGDPVEIRWRSGGDPVIRGRSGGDPEEIPWRSGHQGKIQLCFGPTVGGWVPPPCGRDSGGPSRCRGGGGQGPDAAADIIICAVSVLPLPLLLPLLSWSLCMEAFCPPAAAPNGRDAAAADEKDAAADDSGSTKKRPDRGPPVPLLLLLLLLRCPVMAMASNGDPVVIQLRSGGCQSFGINAPPIHQRLSGLREVGAVLRKKRLANHKDLISSVTNPV